MNFEHIFATACVLIMILILDGIVFYFKGYENGIKEMSSEFEKRMEEESEGTE